MGVSQVGNMRGQHDVTAKNRTNDGRQSPILCACMSISLSLCVCAHVYLFVYVRMCVCVYVCMCVCMYVCMCVGVGVWGLGGWRRRQSLYLGISVVLLGLGALAHQLVAHLSKRRSGVKDHHHGQIRARLPDGVDKELVGLGAPSGHPGLGLRAPDLKPEL